MKFLNLLIASFIHMTVRSEFVVKFSPNVLQKIVKYFLRQLDFPFTAAFVRVEMYHGRRMVKCKRTQSVTGGPSVSEMVFDESFGFGVSGRFFDSCSLAFVVVLEEEGINLGKVVVGPFMYARGDQLQHWQEMLSNPRNTVTRWHPLENSSSQAKKS